MQKRLAWAVVLLSALRIASTWTIYSATMDEPMQTSAALQIWSQHAFGYQAENPPLPRVVIGLAPWLGGMKFDAAAPVNDQLLHVFYSNGRYRTSLVLARAGTLVFFVLGCVAVWLWSRRELGLDGALIAVFLFATQPAVVAHSGLATLDAAATATIAIALLAFSRWMDEPSFARASLFAAAFGVAIASKFSALGYVPAACAAMWVVRATRERDRRLWRRLGWLAAVAAVVVPLCVWAAYGFAVGRLGFLNSIADVTRGNPLGSFIARHPDWPLPAPWFFLGIGALLRLDRGGWLAYALGRISWRGWWWYFPLALAVKTTLASLILALGAVAVRRARVAREALAAFAAILAVSMTSHLDLGIRYVLPLYAPLSVAAAAAAVTMWSSTRKAIRVIAAALLVWHGVATIVAYPDALPYFNEVATRDPGYFLADSNIDWGQDALRLRGVLREKHVENVGLAIMGWHDYDALGFPPHYQLIRDVPTHGWIAVSEHLYRVAGWSWLAGRPFTRVGKSIRLYYVE